MVAEWFDRGLQDLETAKLLIKAKGHTGMVALHIHQATEKYLKGFLVLKNIVPKKTHDLGFLLQNAIPEEPALKPFLDFCDITTRYYLQDRYPPGIPAKYPRSEMKKALRTLERMIKIISA